MSQTAAIKRMDPGKDILFKLVTMGNISFANMLKSAYASGNNF